MIPWANDTVEPVDPGNQYPHEPVGRVFEETAYGLTGIASESRSGDANGQYIRVFAGGGPNTVKIPNAVPGADGVGLQDAVGLTPFPILGSMPNIEDSAKTPFKPNKPCERQEPPNLQAGVGPAPQSASAPAIEPGVDARRPAVEADPRRRATARAARGGGRSCWPSREEQQMTRDPQAPDRLHRRRRADRRRARGHRLHRRGAAPADPGVRGEAVRAQGRVRDRAGGRPRPGPDDPGRRGADRRRRRRRARGRRGRGHVRDRARVPADLQGRDDPDAPDHRAQGHVLRARSGQRPAPASTRRATRSRSPTRRPTSTSTRSSRARLRHPGVPEAADRRRRQGARRPRQATSASCSAGSGRSTATSPSSTRRSRSARRTSPA